MSKLASKILEDAKMLPDDERAEVALKLLAPVGAITDAWRAEIQRRIAELDAGTAKSRAWQDVRADVLKMLSQK